MGDDMFASMSMLNSSIQNAGASFLTAKANKKDREFAREMYQRQVEDARTNWMMQNEYNTPAAQMKRLADAQVNPALYWSKGIGDSGNSAEPESATPLMSETRLPPGMNYISPFEQLAAVLNAEKVRADIAKTGADTSKVKKEIDKLDVDIALENFNVALKEVEVRWADKFKTEEFNKLTQEINNLIQDAVLKTKEGSVMDAEVNLKKAQENLAKIQEKEIRDLLQPRINDLMASVEQKKASAEESRASAENIRELTPKQKAKFDSDLQDAFGKRVGQALSNYFKANGLDNPFTFGSIQGLRVSGQLNEKNIIDIISEQTGDDKDKIRSALFGK